MRVPTTQGTMSPPGPQQGPAPSPEALLMAMALIQQRKSTNIEDDRLPSGKPSGEDVEGEAPYRKASRALGSVEGRPREQTDLDDQGRIIGAEFGKRMKPSGGMLR